MADTPMLVCSSGALAGQSFVVAGDGIEIGRAEENRIVLEEDGVSRFHARLLYDNGSLWLRDLGSRNGVFLNDERLVGHKDLRVGDQIRIGNTVFEVRWASEEEPEPDVASEPPDKPKRSWFGFFDR